MEKVGAALRGFAFLGGLLLDFVSGVRFWVGG